MTDPGWDVPGVPRNASPDAGAPCAADGSASSGAASSPPRSKSRRGAGGERVGVCGMKSTSRRLAVRAR